MNKPNRLALVRTCPQASENVPRSRVEKKRKRTPTPPSPKGEGVSSLSFAKGDLVWYEVARKDGDQFRVPAVVISATERRVLIEFSHWFDGRLVRRLARPHRISGRSGQ